MDEAIGRTPQLECFVADGPAESTDTHDRTHFEFLILEAAQAGLSWSIVLNPLGPPPRI
jgi:3-methyladenine DNA glycosylase Tag